MALLGGAMLRPAMAERPRPSSRAFEVSLASARAAAIAQGQPLYRRFADLSGSEVLAAELVLEKGLLPPEELARILRPETLANLTPRSNP